MHFSESELRERWMARRKKLVAAVAAILRKGVEEGAVRCDIPCDALANFLLGLLRTRARDLAGPLEPRLPDGLLVDFFCRGAAAPQDTK